MPGESKTTQTQSSTTNPWEAAQPALKGILSQLQGQLGNTGITGAESGALNTITGNANAATNQYAPQIGANANELLSGGGATAQSGNISQGFEDYKRRLGLTADGGLIGKNSGLNPYLDTLRDDITTQTNSMFAGAGRDFSGAHFNTLGRGIASGLAPVIAQQFNTDTDNQRSAADALYAGGNTNAGLLAGLQQQSLANKQLGTQAASQALDAQNVGANATLQAEAQRRGIPVQALGLLAQIGIPIAGLGGQSSGTATGTQQDSGMKQFGQFAQGLGGILGNFGTGRAFPKIF